MRLPVHKQALWWGIPALAIFVAMWLLGQAILPFLLGAGIAYLLDPLADRLEKIGLSRTMSVVVITFSAIMILALVILLIMPVLVRQAVSLVETAPEMFAQGKAIILQYFPNVIPEGGSASSALSDLGKTMGEQIGKFAQGILSSISGIFGVIALLVIVPVVTFYLLLDWDNMVAKIDELLPREHASTIRRLASEIDDALSGFLRGQGTVILILGTWYSIGLMLVGLPAGFFIGIMAAVLSFVPYVGVLVGGATAIGVAVFSFWGDPLWIAAVVAIFAIGQVVEGNYLQPKIVGGHIGLHPVWLLLALSVFGALFGFVGLVLAVPLAAAVGVLARFMTGRYLESPLYTGQSEAPEPSPPMLVEIAPPGTLESKLQKAYIKDEIEQIATEEREIREKAEREADETNA